MPPKLIAKLLNSQPLNPSTPQPLNSIVIFLSAFTLLLTFWQVGLLINDEWITANPLTNEPETRLAHRRRNKIRH